MALSPNGRHLARKLTGIGGAGPRQRSCDRPLSMKRTLCVEALEPVSNRSRHRLQSHAPQSTEMGA